MKEGKGGYHHFARGETVPAVQRVTGFGTLDQKMGRGNGQALETLRPESAGREGVSIEFCR